MYVASPIHASYMPVKPLVCARVYPLMLPLMIVVEAKA